jgi:NhaP-type Na+/H+ or K+/H+ antiporter
LPSPLLQLALVVGIGIGAQWLAWRAGVPSILFLLIAGWLSGPILGLIYPDFLLGELLMPIVSLSVGLILFEGGMSLQRKELSVMGSVTWRLVTMGAAVTWVLATLAAHFVLQFEWPVALLMGSILVVTGPTVIGPMLRHIRPTPQAASVLKWEGIVIDPIGALMAVLVYEGTVYYETLSAGMIVGSVVKTVLVGTVLGLAGAAFLLFCLRRYWIPDYLQSPATLALVLVVFALSHTLQHESGLISTTIMGIAVANQNAVVVRHVIAFKENLRVLLLSILFMLLSARLGNDYLTAIDWRAVVFVVLLVLVVRPVSVWVSTAGSRMGYRERALVAWVAPRGIVAAAITSVFAHELSTAGYPDAARMVPVMFFVIAFTVALYGLTAGPVARWLKATQPDPRGLLVVGAHDFARSLASALKEAGVDSVLIDRNSENVRAARLEGLDAHYGDILDETWLDETVSRGLGQVLALTSNDKVNTLAALHFSEVMELRNVFQLPTAKGASALSSAEIPRHFTGRLLFSPGLTYAEIQRRIDEGYRVKVTNITPAFTFQDYLNMHHNEAVPLLIVRDKRAEVIVAADRPRVTGGKIIGLVPPAEPAPAALAEPLPQGA